MRYLTLFTIFAAALLGGCSLISTTTDTTAAIAEGITDATAATADATTGVTDAGAHNYKQAALFVKSQLAYLRRDAAAGQGENLNAFASLMGEANSPDFNQWMQSNYEHVFGPARSSEELVSYIATQRS